MKQLSSGLRRGVNALFGSEKRQAITIPVCAILLSLIAGAILFLILDASPAEAYKSLLQGSGLFPKEKYAGGKSVLTDFTSFVNAWTPMLFAALGVAVALRAGLFNIGVAGQMLVGGFVSTVIIGYSELPAVLAKPLVLLVALVVGALVGGFIGLLKYRFNINEVVASIMINYIIQYVVGFFINIKYIDQISRQSRIVSSAARLTLMSTPIGDLKVDIPLGMIVALVAVFALQFFIEKTTTGYEIKAVGANNKAAQYAGIKVGRTLVLSMAISGGLAGMAGATYYLGFYGSIPPGILPGIGYDSIAVALLAGGNPIGTIFSSFVVTILSKGSVYMSSSVGLMAEIASLITGIVLLFSACGAYIQHLVKRNRDKLLEEKGGK